MTAVILLALLLQAEVQSARNAAEWKQIGVSAAANKRLDEALAAFQKACALDQSDEDACYYLGRTFFALGRWDEALQPFGIALRAAPRLKLARVHRASALNFIALNRPADAERHLRQAVLLYPGPELLPEDPRIDLGVFLFRQGRTEDALSPLQEAAKAVTASGRAHMELGRVLLHLGKSGQAVTALEEALKVQPDSSAVHLLLGRAYLQDGRTADGERQLELSRRGL